MTTRQPPLRHPTMPRLLTMSRLLRLAGRLGEEEVRDAGLIEAALARPLAGVFGQDAYPDDWLKAAALMESLARNHALVDGNKRISWYAAWVFLHLNGHRLAEQPDVDRAEHFVLDVCQGRLGVEEIAAGLRGFAEPAAV